MATHIIKHVHELTEFVKQQKLNRKTIGVVPTMGALHEGHLSLARKSLERADVSIVTIFLNPTQFSPDEDLKKYPSNIEQDVKKLEELNSENLIVFAPSVDQVYPASMTTTIAPPEIAKRLEGEFRPDHFAGVATVVLKLLNMTEADFAFFGEKDFQQLVVIRQLVADLNLSVEIVACPIVRESDGLALSSRNVYLTEEERTIALSLNATLDEIEQQIKDGLNDGFEIITEMRQALIDGGVDSIDYAIIANPTTLEMMDPIELPAVALIAVHVGTTRLIDNRYIE